MADVRFRINAETDLLSTFDTSNNRENPSLQQARPISREPEYVNNSGAFDRDTNLEIWNVNFTSLPKLINHATF